MFFYRSVTPARTLKGTNYVRTFWWSGRCDVWIKGVVFKNLTTEEYNYFHKEF